MCPASVCAAAVYLLILPRLGVLACYSPTVPDLPPDLKEGFLSQLDQCANPTAKKVDPTRSGCAAFLRLLSSRAVSPPPEGEGDHLQFCGVALQRDPAAAPAGQQRERAVPQTDLHDPLGRLQRASEELHRAVDAEPDARPGQEEAGGVEGNLRKPAPPNSDGFLLTTRCASLSAGTSPARS